MFGRSLLHQFETLPQDSYEQQAQKMYGKSYGVLDSAHQQNVGTQLLIDMAHAQTPMLEERLAARQAAINALNSSPPIPTKQYNEQLSQAGLGELRVKEHGGLFNKITHNGILHGVEKTVRKPFKVVAPIAAGIVGGIYGGPAGAALAGGAVRSMVNHNHGSFGKNFTQGAALGTLGTFGAPMAGGAMGVSSTGGLGTALGMGTAHGGMAAGWGSGMASGLSSLAGKGGSFLSGVGDMMGSGVSGLGGLLGGGGGGLMNGLGALGALGNIFGKGGSQLDPYGRPYNQNGGFWGGGEGGNDAMDPLMMGLGAIGSLIGKKKLKDKDRKKSIEEDMEASGLGPNAKALHARGPERRQRQFTPGGSDWKFFEDQGPVEYYRYARGGPVRGNSSGVADNVDMTVPKKGFVLNSTDISLMGDGNTDAGFETWQEFQSKKLRDFERKYGKSNVNKLKKGGSPIKAKLSNGEFVVSPRAVTAIGNGNNNAGANAIETMRRNLRRHKGVSSILPPKTKSLERYMR